MAIISTTAYKSIVSDYSTALTQLSGIAQNYYDAAYKILTLDNSQGSQAFVPEIDLLIPFYNAYQTGQVSYAAQPQSVVNAVRALQNHIIAQGASFTSVNDYYADDGTFADYFTTEFAALSQQAGHTISDTYIV